MVSTLPPLLMGAWVLSQIGELNPINCVLVFSHSVMSESSATTQTLARQAPLSMGFSRQEYWGGLPFPPLVDLPNPRISQVYLIGRWILNHCATWRWGKYLLFSSLRSLPSHRMEGTWAPNQHRPPFTARNTHTGLLRRQGADF